MNSDANASKQSSATTSTKEPPAATEAEYLQRQMDEARAALSRVMDQIKADLSQAADPRLWARDYPLASTGAALLSGFVAGLTLVPSRKQRRLKRRAKLYREAVASLEKERSRPLAKPQSSLFSRLGQEAMNLVKPALASAISAGIGSRMAQPAPPPPSPEAAMAPDVAAAQI